MSKPIAPQELAAIRQAQWAVRRIVDECPSHLEGTTLFQSLIALLLASQVHGNPAHNDLGNLGIAAAALAALAALVENERAQLRGEKAGAV